LRGESEVPSQPSTYWRDRYGRDDTGWVSFGAFLIIVAVIYLTTPSIVGEVEAFIHDFQLEQIFNNFWWFVPSTSHSVVYGAAEKFCYLFGVVQLGIMALKFAKRSSIHAKAETASGIVFWFGMGYLLSLLAGNTVSWISFLAGFIILVGVSIIIRSLILLFSPRGPR
jgi:hypothetical protein